MSTVLLETQRALARAKAELGERDASARAPLVAAQQQVDAVRAEIAALTRRLEALTHEEKTAVQRRPMNDAEVLQVSRLLLAVPIFIAAAVALPEHGTVQMMIGGLVVACVAVGRGIGG